MSRNNRNRLNKGLEQKKPADADIPAPALGMGHEDLFSFSTPTEIVQLPSGGRFYPKNHPMHNIGEIEIKHMTAKEEDILTSKTLLKNGLAIDRLLQSVIVDKSINANGLLVGDKNALLVAARITGFGENYEANSICPSCMSTVSLEYDLSEATIYCPEELPDGVTITEDNVFLVSLPALKVEIGLRLLTGKDENYLMQLAENKKKKNLPESNVTDQLRMILHSAVGKTERVVIEELIKHLPTRDSKFIQEIYNQITPDIKLEMDFECEQCGHLESNMGVPLTTAFFWPNR